MLISQVSSRLRIDIAEDGTYKILSGNEVWLESAPSFIQANGQKYSTADRSLILDGRPVISHGDDKFGNWTRTSLIYAFKESSLRNKTIKLSFQSYQRKSFVIFEQFFPDSLSETSTGDQNSVISAFPSFHVGSRPHLGLLSYGGQFFWTGNTLQRWKRGMNKMASGLDGGVVVLFNQAGHAMVMSAYSNFMSTSVSHDTNESTISWGLMGRVGSVPAGYRQRTILYHSTHGINAAMRSWGHTLRTHYGKRHVSDVTVDYLGYYTDNGGYYYTGPAPNMTYEETLLAINRQATQLRIPYRYLQYDDWWYNITSPGYGETLLWSARPDVFPHGLSYLYNVTQLPVLAHNRMWSAHTPYATVNGGNYTFLQSKNPKLALPLEQRFWEDLFAGAVQWGLVTYEQDFLSWQFRDIPELSEDLDLGHQWLLQMGRAAEMYDVTIQYCMATPRYALQSLEISSVTQIRVSSDYMHTRDNQWRIGISSMLAAALGLAPFKDNFWSKSKQPGNAYNRVEPSPRLQAAVSLLSGGPVAPSDRLGYTNTYLLQELSRMDGRLLKTSRTATAIDDQIIASVFENSAGPKGQVFTTYSNINAHKFGVILAANLSNTYSLTPRKAGFHKFGVSIVYRSEAALCTSCRLPVLSEDLPLLLTPACTVKDFCLYYTAPVWTLRGMNVSILGELDKMVPISPQRITDIEVQQDDILVSLTGVEHEKVKIYVYLESRTVEIACRISRGLRARISIANKMCYTQL